MPFIAFYIKILQAIQNTIFPVSTKHVHTKWYSERFSNVDFLFFENKPPPPPPRTSWRRFAGALFQRSKISHLRSDHYTTWSYRGGKIVSSTMAFSYLFGNTQMSILSWLLEAEKSSVLPQISATFLGMPKCLFCRGCSRGKIVSSTTDFSYLFGNARMSIFFLQQL